MSSRLSRFEELAERLVERSLSRFFTGGLHPQEVATRLARVMEDSVQGNVAPDRYLVYLCADDAERLLSVEPDLGQILGDHLVMLAEQARLVLRRNPIVELLPDPDQVRQTVTIVAEITGEESEYTRTLDPVMLRKQLLREPDGTTYLIVEGGRHLPLTKTIYTLGRRLDCDVVLADPRVSRRHAQLRWRSGRYVLFDLGSTGGTTVNGHLIREAVLEPGDVFSLGGVDIIYGIEAFQGEPAKDTTPTRPWGGPARGAEHKPSEVS